MKRIILLCLLLFPVSFATAEGKVSLEMKVMEEVEIVNENGQKEINYIDSTSIVPGDVVLYTVTYHNQGTEPAGAIIITNPIPEHMLFINESDHGSAAIIKFSVDGGKTFDTADKLSVLTEKGLLRPAIPGDYSHIQWELKKTLNPDVKGVVGYRSKLK